jgi:multidrug resistance protein, MATE family
MDEKVDAIAVRGDLRHVLSLLVAPTLITQLTMTVGWLGETYFVKQLGDEAIAAIGSAGQVSWLLMVLSMMVSAGATTLIAQSWGAGDLHSAQKVVTATLQQGAFAFRATCHEPLVLQRPENLGLAWNPAESQNLSHSLLRRLLARLPVQKREAGMEFGMMSLYRGIGDMVTPMYSMQGKE